MYGTSFLTMQGPPAKKGKWTTPMTGPPTATPAGGAAAGQSEGEVRFENATSVQAAVKMSGTMLGGSTITVTPDTKSKDGTKVIVRGFGAQIEWQELKDHFRSCGPVAHADVKGKSTGVKRDAYPSTGQVRMSTAEEANMALETLNGSQLMGSAIEVKLHTGSKDGTKLIITGIPAGAAWQELKDHFAPCGKVEHAETTPIVPGKMLTGEVRFEDPSHAQLALKTLNGSQLGTSQIYLSMDLRSKDMTKIIISGIGPEVEWQELKDHFSPIGTVAFADLHKAKGGGKGWGGGGWNAGKGGCGKEAMFGGCWGAMGAMTGGCKGGAAAAMMGGKAAMAMAMAGKGIKGGCGGVACAGGMKPGQSGTVRFENMYQAQMAWSSLNGALLNGSQLQVDMDWNSKDGTKLWIGNIAPGTGWQDLKDLFSQCGTVAYANIGNAKGKGKSTN